MGVPLPIVPAADPVGGAFVGVFPSLPMEPLGRIVRVGEVLKVLPATTAPEEAEPASEGDEDTEGEGDTLGVSVPLSAAAPAPPEVSEGRIERDGREVGVVKAFKAVGVPPPPGDTVVPTVRVTPLVGEMEGEGEVVPATPAVALPKIALLPEELGVGEGRVVRVIIVTLPCGVADLHTLLLCVDFPRMEAVPAAPAAPGGESVPEKDPKEEDEMEMEALEDVETRGEEVVEREGGVEADPPPPTNKLKEGEEDRERFTEAVPPTLPPPLLPLAEAVANTGVLEPHIVGLKVAGAMLPVGAPLELGAMGEEERFEEGEGMNGEALPDGVSMGDKVDCKKGEAEAEVLFNGVVEGVERGGERDAVGEREGAFWVGLAEEDRVLKPLVALLVNEGVPEEVAVAFAPAEAVAAPSPAVWVEMEDTVIDTPEGVAWEEPLGATDKDPVEVGSSGDPVAVVQGEGEKAAVKDCKPVAEEERLGEEVGKSGVPLAALDADKSPLGVPLAEGMADGEEAGEKVEE